MKILILAALIAATANSAFAISKAQPPKNKISEETAKTIALKNVRGEIKSSELEFEKGQWVYSFDIKGSDHRIHEILINAISGKVVDQSIETSAAEAREATEDQANRR